MNNHLQDLQICSSVSNNFHGKLVSSLSIKFTDILQVAPDPIFVANLNLLNSELDILCLNCRIVSVYIDII